MVSTSSHTNQTHYTHHIFTSFIRLIDTTTISKNAVLQSNTIEQINLATKSISEHQQMIEITADSLLKDILTFKMIKKQKIVSE